MIAPPVGLEDDGLAAGRIEAEAEPRLQGHVAHRVEARGPDGGRQAAAPASQPGAQVQGHEAIEADVILEVERRILEAGVELDLAAPGAGDYPAERPGGGLRRLEDRIEQPIARAPGQAAVSPALRQPRPHGVLTAQLEPVAQAQGDHIQLPADGQGGAAGPPALPERRVLVAPRVDFAHGPQPRDVRAGVGIEPVGAAQPPEAHLQEAAGRGDPLPRQVVEQVTPLGALGRFGTLESTQPEPLDVGQERGEGERHRVGRRRLPVELSQQLEVALLGHLRGELPGDEPDVIQDPLVALHQLAEDGIGEATPDERPPGIPVRLPPRGRLLTDLGGVEIGPVETTGFEIDPKRAVELAPARLGDDVDDPALEIAVLRAGAQSLDLDPVDPGHVGLEQVAPQAGMVYRDAVEQVVVGLGGGGAPDLIGPDPWQKPDQRADLVGGGEQRQFPLGHHPPVLALGPVDRHHRLGRDHQRIDRQRHLGQPDGDGSSGTRLHRHRVQGDRLKPDPADMEPVAAGRQFAEPEPPGAVAGGGLGRPAPERRLDHRAADRGALLAQHPADQPGGPSLLGPERRDPDGDPCRDQQGEQLVGSHAAPQGDASGGAVPSIGPGWAGRKPDGSGSALQPLTSGLRT